MRGSTMSPEISTPSASLNSAACSGECPVPTITRQRRPPIGIDSPSAIRRNDCGISGTSDGKCLRTREPSASSCGPSAMPLRR